LGILERGGNLYFESNETCQFQLTNYNADNITVRLTYDGFDMDPIVQGFSYNGTFPNDGTGCSISWSWGFLMIQESNWSLIMGIVGIVLLLVGLLLMAYLIKTYPIFSLHGEMLFDKIAFAISMAMIIIGFGFIMMWMMA